MNITTAKKQIAFRFSEELIKRLRINARMQHRSLNSYVEMVLTDIAFDEPNEETIKAIEDKNISTLDLKEFKEFVASL